MKNSTNIRHYGLIVLLKLYFNCSNALLLLYLIVNCDEISINNNHCVPQYYSTCSKGKLSKMHKDNYKVSILDFSASLFQAMNLNQYEYHINLNQLYPLKKRNIIPT